MRNIAISLRLDTTGFLEEHEAPHVHSRFGITPKELRRVAANDLRGVQAIHIHHSTKLRVTT